MVRHGSQNWRPPVVRSFQRGFLVELVDHSGGGLSSSTFGASLRAARLSRNISLDDVAAHTKINSTYLQDLEKNDLSKWPSSQFYRESYVRAYAEAIGLDPREVIDGFRREVAAGEASILAAPSPKPRRLTPVTIPIILAVTFVLAYVLVRWVAHVPGTQAVAVGRAAAAMPAEAKKADTSTKEPAAPQARAIAPVAPVEPKPVAGELLITSTPSGAQVMVNGIGRGRSPVRVQSLSAGSYNVRFVLPGHRSVTQRATISPERSRVEVSVTLEPAAPKPAPDPAPERAADSAPDREPAPAPTSGPAPEQASEPAPEPESVPTPR